MTLYHLHTRIIDGDTYEFFLKEGRLLGSLNGSLLPLEGLPGELKQDISEDVLPAITALLQASYFALTVFCRTNQKAIQIKPLDKTNLYENVSYKYYLMLASN